MTARQLWERAQELGREDVELMFTTCSYTDQGWGIERRPPDPVHKVYNIVAVCPMCGEEHYVLFRQCGDPPPEWKTLTRIVRERLKSCTCGCRVNGEPVRRY